MAKIIQRAIKLNNQKQWTRNQKAIKSKQKQSKAIKTQPGAMGKKHTETIEVNETRSNTIESNHKAVKSNINRNHK